MPEESGLQTSNFARTASKGNSSGFTLRQKKTNYSLAGSSSTYCPQYGAYLSTMGRSLHPDTTIYI